MNINAEQQADKDYTLLITEYAQKLNDGHVLISATDTLISYFAQYTPQGYLKLLEYTQDKQDTTTMPIMYYAPKNNTNILIQLLGRHPTTLERILLDTFIPHIILITQKADGSKIAIRSTHLKILQDILTQASGALYTLELNLLKIKSDEVKRLADVTMITNQYTELNLNTYSNLHSCIVDITRITHDQYIDNTILIEHDYAIDMQKLSTIALEHGLSYKITPSSMIEK